MQEFKNPFRVFSFLKARNLLNYNEKRLKFEEVKKMELGNEMLCNILKENRKIHSIIEK